MRVVHRTDGELIERRVRLLTELRMTRDELEERARKGLLTAEEHCVWEQVRSVDFLLGEDASLDEWATAR